MDLAFLSAGIGAGLVVIGAGFGIGKIASSAMDASGRNLKYWVKSEHR